MEKRYDADVHICVCIPLSAVSNTQIIQTKVNEKVHTERKRIYDFLLSESLTFFS